MVGGDLSYFCLLPASLRGGRVVVEPLEGLLPAGVVSGTYIVYALFEHKKEIFSVYIVYALFYFFLPAGLPAGVCVLIVCGEKNVCT